MSYIRAMDFLFKGPSKDPKLKRFLKRSFSFGSPIKGELKGQQFLKLAKEPFIKDVINQGRGVAKRWS